MNSLNKKLSLLLLILFIATGIVLAMITRYSTIQYNHEITQRLNESIAMYVAQEDQLIRDGQYDEAALKRLAHRAMIINPSVEVYLLNNEGEILSYNLPENSVILDQIDLMPVTEFMKKDSKRPLLSQDPRNPESEKVFSAARITWNGKNEGYVYAILGGQKYEALASDISKNYVMKIALSSILAVIVLAFLIGFTILIKLTKPLTLLKNKVINFQKSSQNDSVIYSGDEIQQLDSAFADMSERIENQIRQIQNADKARRELITNVSHDLRTPLASMQGYLDTLLIKKDTMKADQTEEYLKIARNHCGRLGKLINDLFELSKLDSHITNLNLEVFSLSELMQDVALEFKPAADKKQLELKLCLLEGNTDIRADIGLMQRVLENLIGNAIKHTPDSGTVLIALESDGDRFNVIIEDTGRGISQHEIPYIFDRLYRANNTSDESETSSGLGLAIVKKVLDLHKTKIQVMSKLDKGTRFSFQLPLASH